MIAAVLDTNVLVQSLISSPQSASARVLDAYYDGRFLLPYSSETLDELFNVLAVPRIRERHGLSDDETLDFIGSLILVGGQSHSLARAPAISPSIARDVTDTKFLALAEASAARYLVTNDRRHLLRLRRYKRTRIVTPATFLRELP